ncbi:MAG: thioredoxin-related protein [Pseudoalteromonas tetraodonis]|jgi:thioredoxin-related protein
MSPKMLIVLSLRILVAAFLLGNLSVAAAKSWQSDLTLAVEDAKLHGKNLLIVFRGTNSSPPCKEMNEDILDDVRFMEALSTDFVLFSVPDLRDTPKGEGRARHKTLMEKFRVTSYPIIFLADDEARVYAQIPLQRPSLEQTLAEISALAPRHAALDKLFSAQRLPDDADDKNRLISEALETLGEKISLAHHQEMIDRLIEADPDGTLGYVEVWRRRKATAEALSAFGRVYSEIAPVLWNLKSANEMVALLDTTIVDRELQGELRQLVEMQKYRVWGMEKNYAKMIESAERAQALVPDSPLAGRIPAIIARVKILQEAAAANPIGSETKAALEEMQDVPEPAEGTLGSKARELARFNKVYASIKPMLDKKQSVGEKVALLESTIKDLQLVGSVKQLMLMETYRLWAAEGDTQMALKSGNATIEVDPSSGLGRRLKIMLERMKTPPAATSGAAPAGSSAQ